MVLGIIFTFLGVGFLLFSLVAILSSISTINKEIKRERNVLDFIAGTVEKINNNISREE